MVSRQAVAYGKPKAKEALSPLQKDATRLRESGSEFSCTFDPFAVMPGIPFYTVEQQPEEIEFKNSQIVMPTPQLRQKKDQDDRRPRRRTLNEFEITRTLGKFQRVRHNLPASLL